MCYFIREIILKNESPKCLKNYNFVSENVNIHIRIKEIHNSNSLQFHLTSAEEMQHRYNKEK